MALAIGEHRSESRSGVPVACRRSTPRRILAISTTSNTRSNKTSSTPTSSPTSLRAFGITSSSTETRVSSSRCGQLSTARSSSFSTCNNREGKSCGPVTPTAHRGHSPCSRLVLDRAFAALCDRHSRKSSVRNGPDWELSLGQLANAIRHERADAFSPKHRWAMDWYYPVLSGVISGEAGRAHLAARFDTFNLEDKGIRCVSDRPWITTAEDL